MKPEILVLGSVWPADVRALLEQRFVCHDRLDTGIAGRVRAVLTTGGIGIGEALAAQLPALEIVAVHGVGLDAVAVQPLRARGVEVTNTPDVLTDDVADLAVCLLLAAVRRLPALDRYVRAGHWPARLPLAQTRSLKGQVAGIVGFGRIGQAVAARLGGFGVDIRYFQRSPGPDLAQRSASLLALAQESDILVVCTPGGDSTRHLIDAAIIEALGPEGTLVNIARGSVVDETALVDALRGGRLGAAALDVFENEPQVPEALRALDNVVLTPHVGSLTVEARRAMVQLTVANLLAHFDGKPLLTPVA